MVIEYFVKREPLLYQLVSARITNQPLLVKPGGETCLLRPGKSVLAGNPQIQTRILVDPQDV